MILTKRLLRWLRPRPAFIRLNHQGLQNKELPPPPPAASPNACPSPSRNPTDEVHESRFNLSRNPAHMLDRPHCVAGK